MMKPVTGWPNGLICYTEADIRAREYLIRAISCSMQDWMRTLNRGISFERVETPCLIPKEVASAHIDADFPLWHVSGGQLEKIEDDEHLWLRPESTAGTYKMFSELYPQESHLRKVLPLCLWQVSLSFRREQDKTFSNLRFKQFYQLEFQLAYAEGTKADYHTHAVEGMIELLKFLFPLCARDKSIYPLILGDEIDEQRPFYSAKTTDIYVTDTEMVAISTRTDFRYPILEISCGLDRLTALYQLGFDRSDYA